MKKGQELINALSDAKTLTTDIGEALLDSILKEGIAKEIPVIGSFVKLVSVGKNINGYLFTKKLLKFFATLKDIPREEIEAFQKKLQDEKKLEEVGDKLMLIINQTDEFEKCEIIGKIFAFYLEGNLSHIHFQRLCLSVNKVFSYDLMKLVNEEFPLGDSMISLMNSGFVMQAIHGQGNALNSYYETDDGKLIRKILKREDK